MFRAIITEVKNSITKSFFHIIRFGGLLLIPFIYGFSYIYAFYDPFTKVDQVKVSIVTNKKSDHSNPATDTDPEDKTFYLANAIGKQATKNSQIVMGDINMSMKMEHIYRESDEQLDSIKKDSYATITLNDLSTFDTIIGDAIVSQLATNPPINNLTNILIKGGAIARTFTGILEKLATNDKDFEFTLNYKKNYLLAFGIDTGASMISSIKFVQLQMIKALKDPEYLKHIWDVYVNPSSIIPAANKPANLSDFQKIGVKLSDSILSSINQTKLINVEAHMGDHAKYGYGLAPFFISVAMWIGGMVMTFAVHRKIYDKTIPAGKRYFAKWIVIITGIILQATILMTSLYFIGFSELGLDHWLSLYIGAIICGVIFSSVIQAIRFSIHDRTIGILLTIILLVLQMASGGGLFPIETQSSFYRVVNKIVPMGWSVKILRELSFETNWAQVFKDFGFLAMWLFIVPVGVVINHYRTIRIYRAENWRLPKTMAYWEYIRQEKKKIRNAKKGRF